MNLTQRDSCPEFITKDTSIIREIMAPANSNVVRQSLAEATVMPQKSTVAHSHPNTEEIYYILSGRGIMAIEDEQFRVVPGDAVGICAGRRHQIYNHGEQPLVFLCCCVPAYSDEDTEACEPLISVT